MDGAPEKSTELDAEGESVSESLRQKDGEGFI